MRRLALVPCCLVALTVTITGCEADGTIDLERMTEQRRAQPYGASPWFPDGRAMRVPPAGTIPRERHTGDPAYTTGRADTLYSAQLPLPLTGDLLRRGRRRFEIVCAACHGVTGDGQSEVAENMLVRRPPSLIAAPVTTFLPGRIFEVITRGYGLMPGYQEEIALEERWAIVAYLRALQLSQGVLLSELPPPLRTRALEALP